MHTQVHALELRRECPPLSEPQGTVVTLEDRHTDLGWYDRLAACIAASGFQTRGFAVAAERPVDLGRRVARATRGLARPLVVVGHGTGALLALRFARWGDVAVSGVIAAAPPEAGHDRTLQPLVEQVRSGNPGIPTLMLHARELGLVRSEDEVIEFLRRIGN